VLRLTASGHSNKVIASKLVIGLKSVDTYKARAMAKLGFHSRVDVVRFALSRGGCRNNNNPSKRRFAFGEATQEDFSKRAKVFFGSFFQKRTPSPSPTLQFRVWYT